MPLKRSSSNKQSRAVAAKTLAASSIPLYPIEFFDADTTARLFIN